MAPFLNITTEDDPLKPLFQILLPKIKVNYHLPFAMIISPCSVCGLGFRSLTQEQFISCLELITSLYNSDSPSAILLTESIENLQIESGLSSLVLLSLYFTFHYLTTETWLSAIWYYLTVYKISLFLPDLSIPSSPHRNNSSIMNVVYNLWIFYSEHLYLINLVQIQL